MQEKHVKEKQCEHQRHIIELQEKLKKNQNSVRTTSTGIHILKFYMHTVNASGQVSAFYGQT